MNAHFVQSASVQSALHQANQLLSANDCRGALEVCLSAADAYEHPPGALCLKIARCYQRLGDTDAMVHWALSAVDAGEEFAVWLACASLLKNVPAASLKARRSARLAVLSSYTTVQFVPLLQIAALRQGIALEIHEGPFGQYQQEVLNPSSVTYAFKPDFLLLAVDERETNLPNHCAQPLEAVEKEMARWRSLWQHAEENSTATIIQHNFALSPEDALGHLGSRLAGSRYRMLQELNRRLAEEAGENVLVLDCDRIAGTFGKERWFDPRYWLLSRQAVALDALPLLARHTAALLAARLGLSRKCLVLDLDNTLWGGTVGEDGVSGLQIGDGPKGEAYLAFQEYLRALKSKGIVLAVCSKNDEAAAKAPFEKHPRMLLRLDDFAAFVANWRPKPENLISISRTLNLGLDSFVFLDDNPAERLAMRRALPAVETPALPDDPALYVRALNRTLLFETAVLTEEDRRRAEQYAARAKADEARASAGSLADFYSSLKMQAIIEPISPEQLLRVVQLLGKTNQFNLTTRRHSLGTVSEFLKDPSCVHFTARLRDCFTDHGLVALLIAFVHGETLSIDTWLMSCRVIGRTLEFEMLRYLCEKGRERGCRSIRGLYIPTEKNGLVRDLFSDLGFRLIEETNGTTTWERSLDDESLPQRSFIQRVASFDTLPEEINDGRLARPA